MLVSISVLTLFILVENFKEKRVKCKHLRQVQAKVTLTTQLKVSCKLGRFAASGAFLGSNTILKIGKT